MKTIASSARWGSIVRYQERSACIAMSNRKRYGKTTSSNRPMRTQSIRPQARHKLNAASLPSSQRRIRSTANHRLKSPRSSDVAQSALPKLIQVRLRMHIKKPTLMPNFRSQRQQPGHSLLGLLCLWIFALAVFIAGAESVSASGGSQVAEPQFEISLRLLRTLMRNRQ